MPAKSQGDNDDIEATTKNLLGDIDAQNAERKSNPDPNKNMADQPQPKGS